MLGLESKIGNFEVDKEFDAVVVDLNENNLDKNYFDQTNIVEDLFEKFIFMGDDRNIK